MFEISSFEKTKLVPPDSVCESHSALNASFCRFHSSSNEYITELWCFWRTSKYHCPLSSRYIKNSICHRILTNWSYKYEMMSLVDPLGETSLYSSPSRFAQISEILKLLLINKPNNLILNLTPENMTQHSGIEWQLHTKEAQHPLKWAK